MSDPNPYGELMLLSGTGNPALSERIAREIDLPLAPMDITRFADGEFDVKIHESVRGHDVFLIQPTCSPVSDNLVQLFITLDALRAAVDKLKPGDAVTIQIERDGKLRYLAFEME